MSNGYIVTSVSTLPEKPERIAAEDELLFLLAELVLPTPIRPSF